MKQRDNNYATPNFVGSTPPVSTLHQLEIDVSDDVIVFDSTQQADDDSDDDSTANTLEVVSEHTTLAPTSSLRDSIVAHVRSMSLIRPRANIRRNHGN